MNDTDASDKAFLRPGKARWLQEKGAKSLDAHQRALLLALADLETELGRELSEEEQSALETIANSLGGYDPAEISRAVRQMVEAPSDPARKTDWPELKRPK